MTKTQRGILIVGGLLCLLFAASEALDTWSPNGWLATVLFLAALVMFYLSARKSPTP